MMMPKNVTELPLSDEQIRRRERNLRYRERLKDKEKTPETSQETGMPILVKPNMLIYSSIVTSLVLLATVNALLVYFQAQTYMDMGMDFWISSAIATICEASLVYLSLSLRKSLASVFLFTCLFVYALGTMSYGIKRDAAIQANGFEEQKVLKESLRNAQEAFEVSASRKESGTMVRHLKTMETLTEKLDKTQIDSSLIRFQSYWLIGLRAILMLISAYMVHGLIRRMRESDII